jgi:transposase
MGRQNKTYPPEFKREAMQLLATSGKGVAELERELGITSGLLWKWKQRNRVDGEAPGMEPTTLEAAKAEIRRLKRELAVTSQERDILKKAISIFSQDGE